MLFTAIARTAFANNSTQDTLSEVGRIISGKRGLPSSSEITREVDKILSPVQSNVCSVDQRIEDILAHEEAEEGNDEDFHCVVVKGEAFTSKTIMGRQYKIPNSVALEDFVANCIASNGDLISGESLSLSNTADNENKFASYSDSDSVDRMIRTLKRNASRCVIAKNRHVCTRKPPKDRKDENKPTGFCLKYVKDAVVAGGFTSTYPPGKAARDSGTQWKKMGFKNLLEQAEYKNMTPYDAPKGAILVYSGGKWGHVEVKASENEYISDYVGEKPIYDELNISRKIIGIYVK